MMHTNALKMKKIQKLHFLPNECGPEDYERDGGYTYMLKSEDIPTNPNQLTKTAKKSLNYFSK